MVIANSCCKGGKYDCYRSALLKFLLGGRYGGGSGIDCGGSGGDSWVLIGIVA